MSKHTPGHGAVQWALFKEYCACSWFLPCVTPHMYHDSLRNCRETGQSTEDSAPSHTYLYAHQFVAVEAKRRGVSVDTRYNVFVTTFSRWRACGTCGTTCRRRAARASTRHSRRWLSSCCWCLRWGCRWARLPASCMRVVRAARVKYWRSCLWSTCSFFVLFFQYSAAGVVTVSIV